MQDKEIIQNIRTYKDSLPSREELWEFILQVEKGIKTRQKERKAGGLKLKKQKSKSYWHRIGKMGGRPRKQTDVRRRSDRKAA